jgi:hypothetical protein
VANPQGQIWHLTTRIYIVTRYNSIYRSLRDAWTAVEISRCGQSECHIAERAWAFCQPRPGLHEGLRQSGSLLFAKRSQYVPCLHALTKLSAGRKRHRDSGSSQSSTKVGNGSELYGGDVIGKPPELSVGEERGANIWS